MYRVRHYNNGNPYTSYTLTKRYGKETKKRSDNDYLTFWKVSTTLDRVKKAFKKQRFYE